MSEKQLTEDTIELKIDKNNLKEYLDFDDEENIFDKMCDKYDFLSYTAPSEYDDIKYFFVKDKDLDWLVSKIIEDGSSDLSKTRIKTIVNKYFFSSDESM